MLHSIWRWNSIVRLLTVAAVLGPLGAVAADFSRLEPAPTFTTATWSVAPASPTIAERQLLDDARDGSWNEHSLIEAALVASGHQEPSDRQRLAAAWTDRLDRWLAEQATGGLAPRRLAEAALVWLHQDTLLGSYDPAATDLASAIQGDAYNCLTATVLYLSAVRALGIEAEAVERPGHVLARVATAEGWLDVETTLGRISGEGQRSVVPNTTTGADRPLSDVELVSGVYYNRGCQALAQERFAEAVTVSRRASALDPKAARAAHNALAAWNQWALRAIQRQCYGQAVLILGEAERNFPRHPSLLANLRWTYARWAVDEAVAGRLAKSLEVLGRSARHVPAARRP